MKPAKPFKWAYGAGAVKTDPDGKAELGYGNEELPFPYLNWKLNLIGEWTEFSDRAFGKTYYVNATTGDDGDDGSALTPFATIKKAVDMIENGGYGTVVVKDASGYTVEENIDLVAKKVIVYADAVAASITALSYIDGVDENNLYGFNLYQGASLILLMNQVTISSPIDPAKAWSADASFVRVYDETSYVGITGITGIGFSNTSASTAVYPSLVSLRLNKSIGIPVVNTGGAITTNGKGYVVNSNGYICAINKAGTIDNNDYWVLGGVNAVRKTTAELTGINKATCTATGRELTLAMNQADGEATTEANFKNFLRQVYPNLTAGDITVNVTIAGALIVDVEFEISGESAQITIGDIKIDDGALYNEYFSVNQGWYRKNVSVLTNVPEIIN